MMYCTEVMVEQHANISRMLKIIQAACCAILEGGEVDQKEFADYPQLCRQSPSSPGRRSPFPRNGR